jgi:hypothetical protein
MPSRAGKLSRVCPIPEREAAFAARRYWLNVKFTSICVITSTGSPFS